MRTLRFTAITVVALMTWLVAHAADPAAAWKIQTLTVVPVRQGESTLVAALQGGPDGQRFELSDRAVLTTVTGAYVSGDRLVALGEAGRSDAVEIFDLTRRAKLDWFYCYEPRRISENWIAYVEFYHAHQAGEPTDVVLVYDLAKSPQENRLEKDPGQVFPQRSSDNPVRVGTPIFPGENARLASYRNVVEVASAARHILGSPFLLLSSGRLVFTCAEGPGLDASTLHNYLVAVDLSRGLMNPLSRMIDIPREKLRRKGSGNPGMTDVARIEEVSPTSVRLVAPANEYGVESALVEVPLF